jgi:hypothetical protein
MYPTWPPFALLKIGDIVRIDEVGMFVTDSSLKKLNIRYESEISDTHAHYSYRSQGSVTVTAHAKVELKTEEIARVESLITVSFSKENSILFDLADIEYESIVDLSSVEAALAKIFDSGKWDNNWLVVTNVMKAKKATILLANSKKSRVNLSIEGTEEIANNLAMAGLKVQDHEDMGFMVAVEGSLTPMGRCLCLRRKMWSPVKFSVPKKAAPKKAAAKSSLPKKIQTSQSKLVTCFNLEYPDNFVSHVEEPADW